MESNGGYQRRRGQYLLEAKFEFGKMRKFWRWKHVHSYEYA
jgi:hypothetical protein